MMGFYPPMEDDNNGHGGAHTKTMNTAKQKYSKCKNISVISQMHPWTPALIVSFFSCSFLLFLITLNSEYILSPTCPKGLFILKYFVCMFFVLFFNLTDRQTDS